MVYEVSVLSRNKVTSITQISSKECLEFMKKPNKKKAQLVLTTY